MPHQIKKPREQQNHRRLPNVEEEPEEEEERGPQASIAKAKAKAKASHGDGDDAERREAVASSGSAMATSSRVEMSPLPLRRAVLTSLAGRKCGPSTPVPSWKMYDNPFADAMATAAAQNYSNPNFNPNSTSKTAAPARSRRITVSARKLAATLWELQDTPGMASLRKGQQGPSQPLKPQNSKQNEAPLPYAPSPASSMVSQRSLRRPSSHNKSGDALRGNPAASTSWSTSAHSQIEVVARAISSSKNGSVDVKAVQRDVEDGTTLSTELLKVLNQIWSLEEQHNVSTSTVSSLRIDLEKTRAHMQELTAEQSSYQEDIERLNKKLTDEKAMLQEREHEAIMVAVKPLKEELENERKSKHKLESQYKKLSKEISEAKKALVKALRDLESEQKARELMEDVCDELAREIGEDKAQVEELKRQSAKVRKEVEEERKMLQMAEVWREERVQMKLAEARLELEEKNTALDKLRSELEAFLRAKRSFDEGNRKVSSLDQATSSTLHVTDSESLSKQHMSPVSPIDALIDKKGASFPIQELNDEVSFDDDLHSIELNKVSLSGSLDGNRWVYSNATHQEIAANGKQSLDRGISLANRTSRGNQGQGSRQGLDRTRSSPVEALVGRSDQSGMQEADSQLMDMDIGRTAFKDWSLGKRPVGETREVVLRSWQSDNEESQGPTMTSTSSKGRSLHGGTDSFSRTGSKGQSTGDTITSLDRHGDGADSKLQSSRGPRDGNSDAVFHPSQQSATLPTSPNCQWGPFWPSPDPVSPRRTRQASKDMSRASRDNSLKAKLLEAKLEGQQAKLRNNKGF